MATLPKIEDLGPRPVMRPQRGVARVSARSPVAEAVQGLGNQITQTGEVIYEREATAAAKERDTYVSDQIRELLYNPESGYLGREGRDAATMRDDVMGRLKRIEDEATQGLNNGAKEKLQAQLVRRMESASMTVDRHAMGGRKDWVNGASAARITAAGQDAVFDMSRTEESLATIRTELRDTAAREGWDADELKVKMREAEGSVYADQIRRMANVDPISALEYMGAHKDKLSPDALVRLEGALVPEAKRWKGRQAGESAARGAIEARRVVEAGAGFTTIELVDGQVVRREGTRAWRNNNPGNIEFGNFAKRHGALGTDGRFAVFPTYEDGRKAKEALLFESSGYRNLSIASGISRYAPQFENDTGAYIRQVAGAVGVDPFTPLSQLTPSQRSIMLNAMEEVEGFRKGVEKGGSSISAGGIEQILEIEDPIEREAAMNEYSLILGVEQGKVKARQDQAAQGAYELVSGGGNLMDISMDQRNLLGREEMSGLLSLQRTLASGETVQTDNELYVGLMEMYSDPSRRGEFLAQKPLEWAGSLSQSDWESFVSKQAEVRKGTATSAPSIATIMTTSDASLRAAGIVKNDNPEQYAAFQAQMAAWAEANPEDAGSPSALQAEISRRLMPVVLDPKGLRNKQKGRLFEIDLDGDPLDPDDDVTPSMLRGGALRFNDKAVSNDLIEEFATAFEGRFGRAPTVEELIDGMAGSGLF